MDQEEVDCTQMSPPTAVPWPLVPKASSSLLHPPIWPQAEAGGAVFEEVLRLMVPMGWGKGRCCQHSTLADCG